MRCNRRSFSLVFASTLLGAGCGGAVGPTGPTTTAAGDPPDPPSPAAPGTTVATGEGTPPSTSGRCGAAARTVATVAGTAEAIALDPTAILVAAGDRTSGTRTLSTIDPISGTPSVVASARDLRLVGVDRGVVVWSAGTDGHLYSAPVGGGPSADLGVRLADYQGAYSSKPVDVAGGIVLWVDRKTATGDFYSLSVSGGAIGRHTLATGGPPPQSWVAAEGSLLWATSSALWMGLLPDGARPAQIGPTSFATTILGYRSGWAYVMRDGSIDAIAASGAVRRIGSTWTSEYPPAAANCANRGKYGSSGFIVGHDETVYRTTWTDCMDGRFAYSVQRTRPGDSKPTDLSAFVTTGMAEVPKAVDDACFYWFERDGAISTLKTIAK